MILKYWRPKLNAYIYDIIFFLMYLENGNITVSGHDKCKGKGFLK